MAEKSKPLNYNYAIDRDFANTTMQNLMNIWQMLRSSRAQREMVWMESYRAWTADRLHVDENYGGRAQNYWPQLRKEVETMTRRMMKGIFTDDYLRAHTDRFEDEDLTIANSQVVQHYLENVMRFPVQAEPWIKQGVLYGTSPLRTYWKREVNEQFFRERYFVKDDQGNLIPKAKTVQKPVVRYNAPVARAEDIFQTWIYPHNIPHASEAEAVYNRSHLRWSDLLARQSKSMAIGINDDLIRQTIDQAKDEDSFYVKMCHEQKLQGLMSTIDYPRNLERLLQFADAGRFEAIQHNTYFDLMEVWVNLELPDTKTPVPCVVEILNYMFPIRIQRNPFWHQSNPMDWMRFIKPPPGEFYGRGLPEATIYMQSQLNDLLNQGMDSATLALNNITIINPAYAPNSESFEVEPGAQWYADPNGVKQFTFPDLSEVAVKNAQVVRQIITEMSDNAPQLPDPIAGKARSTGQAQMAMDEWSTDMYAFLRSISEEALAPFAQKIHMLIQQNVSDDEIIKITGKYAGKWIDRVMTPDDILNNYSFHWETTIQIQQGQVKTQQMLQFIKTFATLPPQAQAGVRLNWDNFLIKLLRDGFLIKDTTTIIETPRETMSTPPDLENRIIKQGGEVMVTQSDDDDLHIAVHKREADKVKETDLYIRSLFDQHIQLHDQQKADKAKAAAEAQIQQQQQMALLAAQSNVKTEGRRLKPPASPGRGNPSQINESQNISDMTKGMGNA